MYDHDRGDASGEKLRVSILVVRLNQDRECPKEKRAFMYTSRLNCRYETKSARDLE